MAMRDISEIESLGTLDDGRLALSYQRHLQRLIADCENRPMDKTARELTITLKVTPSLVEEGYLSDVNIEGHLKSKVPAHVTRPVNCRVKAKQRAVFNDMAEDNAAQRTIDEIGA